MFSVLSQDSRLQVADRSGSEKSGPAPAERNVRRSSSEGERLAISSTFLMLLLLPARVCLHWPYGPGPISTGLVGLSGSMGNDLLLRTLPSERSLSPFVAFRALSSHPHIVCA